MKINDNLKVRTVAGENIVMMQGVDGTDMTRVVALNESALLLFNRLSGREFEVDDVVRVLTDEYEAHRCKNGCPEVNPYDLYDFLEYKCTFVRYDDEDFETITKIRVK